MRSSLATLKLVLDELAVEPSISSLGDRKVLQKAVFLAQGVGVNLGYSYGWYLRGPYSPSLTRDYFALDDALASGEDDLGDLRLRQDVAARLASLRVIFEVPADVSLSKPAWLELLASVRYLETDRKLAPQNADAILERQKPALFPYRDAARRALVRASFATTAA